MMIFLLLVRTLAAVELYVYESLYVCDYLSQKCVFGVPEIIYKVGLYYIC